MGRNIIGIGETVLDVIFRNDNPTAAVPGGSTFNALVSLGRTIKKVSPESEIRMVTEVGDDHIGDIIVSFMEKNGVCTDAVTRNKGSQSHISMAFLDENNDARYEFYKDHAHAGLSAERVGTVEFKKDDIVLFGSYFAINPVIREHTRELLSRASASGAIIYYDINFRPNHIKDLPETMGNIVENCRFSDVVRGSAEDFQFLFGTGDGREIYEKHIAPLCRNFILTRGSAPVQVFTGDGEMEFPVEQIETVSTIGAGDNFNAGFVYSLISEGIRLQDLKDLGRDGRKHIDSGWWSRSLCIATSFSAAACRSTFNYVDEDFEPSAILRNSGL